MFRDMSGLAQTAALAQAGVQASAAAGATAAGQQAANTLATVLANNTERMRIAAQLLAGTGGIGGGGGGPSLPARAPSPNAAASSTPRRRSAIRSTRVPARAGSAVHWVAADLVVDPAAAEWVARYTGTGGGDASDEELFEMPTTTTGAPSPGTQLVADVFRQQFAADGTSRSPTVERFAQTLLNSTGGGEGILFAKTCNGSGSGSGSGGGTVTKAKARTIEVTGRFMLHTDKPLKFGGITMLVYEGDIGRLLWKIGPLNDPVMKYVDAFTNGNEIKTPKLKGVMSDFVTVELKLKPRLIDEDLMGAPGSMPSFGTARVFELPRDGKLLVVPSVARSLVTVNVTASNRDDAFLKGNQKLTDAQRKFSEIDDAVERSTGNWRVTFWIYEKRLLVRTPKSVREIY